MTEDSCSEVIAKEIPQLISVLNEMTSKVTDVIKHVDVLQVHIKDEEFSTEKGISLLEVKYHLLLSYLINLVQLMLHKNEGQRICESSCVDRLVEIRTVLEKIRPLDQKLRYQIDKLLKTAATGFAVAAADPLRFKPNPGSLVPKLQIDGEEDNNAKEKTRLYVPPRVHAMPYGEDDTNEVKIEKKRKKAMKSSLLQELQEEFSDAPHEVKEYTRSRMQRQKEVEDVKEQEKYEEEYFVRLGGRKRRKDSGREMAEKSLEELMDFGGLSNEKRRKKLFSKRRKLIRKKKGKKPTVNSRRRK